MRRAVSGGKDIQEGEKVLRMQPVSGLRLCHLGRTLRRYLPRLPNPGIEHQAQEKREIVPRVPEKGVRVSEAVREGLRNYVPLIPILIGCWMFGLYFGSPFLIFLAASFHPFRFFPFAFR